MNVPASFHSLWTRATHAPGQQLWLDYQVDYPFANAPNLFQNNLWWAIVDYEEFFVTDKQLDERFANRRRAKIGIGYWLNYTNRFELIYTRQSSRHEIEGEFTNLDNVLRLRYKMYLNPSGPKSTGTDIP